MSGSHSSIEVRHVCLQGVGETTNPQKATYPPLDLTKSQFRILWLHPGRHNDQIVAMIRTSHLPALPHTFKDDTHLTQLKDVYEKLSSAVDQRSRMQFAEVERWARLREELLDLYLTRLLYQRHRSLEAAGLVEDPYILPQTDEFIDLDKLTSSFISRVKEYQGVSPYPFEAGCLRVLIVQLEKSTRSMGGCLLLDGYEAVSYYCGDQTIKEEICLNGTQTQVPVTAASALRELRRETVIRVLWIDAICIDQNNATERAHQVLRMAQIYSSANRTLVWLGDEDKTIPGGLSSYLRPLTTESARLEADKIPHDAKLIFNDGGVEVCLAKHIPLEDGGLPCPERKEMDYQAHVATLAAMLSKYLERPWFSRLWTFQEVLLSQNCVCCIGSYELDWKLVQDALWTDQRLLSKIRQRERLNVYELGQASPWMRMALVAPETGIPPNLPLSLKQLLLETMPLRCSDERDKIYAVIGLTQWTRRRQPVPHRIWPDYKKTVSDCMRDATVAVIQEDKNLDCLALRRLNGSQPTWVIPWHQLGDDLSILGYWNLTRPIPRKEYLQNCSKGRALDCVNMMRRTSPNSLFLREHRFRKVARISKVASLETFHKKQIGHGVETD